MLHPLTQNPWLIDTDRESGPVSLSHLNQLDRTRYAIQTIARMVGNSAAEPDATGSPPLDPWAITALMGGVESLCEHLGTLTEAMVDQALQADGEREAPNPPTTLPPRSNNIHENNSYITGNLYRFEDRPARPCNACSLIAVHAFKKIPRYESHRIPHSSPDRAGRRR